MQTITKPAVALTKPGKQPAAMGMLIKKAAFVKRPPATTVPAAIFHGYT
jgi:hypothetical protein